MATRLTDEFPARTKAPTAAYPDGSYMNETAPGANDGTPLDERIGDDYEGLKQSLLAKAGITPNGQPDSVTNPQQLSAIEKFDNDRQKETAGLSDITEASIGLDIFPLIGEGLRVAGVGLWVVPSVTADGSPMPNPALLDATPTDQFVTVNGGTEVILVRKDGDTLIVDAVKYGLIPNTDCTNAIRNAIVAANSVGVAQNSTVEVITYGGPYLIDLSLGNGITGEAAVPLLNRTWLKGTGYFKAIDGSYASGNPPFFSNEQSPNGSEHIYVSDITVDSNATNNVQGFGGCINILFGRPIGASGGPGAQGVKHGFIKDTKHVDNSFIAIQVKNESNDVEVSGNFNEGGEFTIQTANSSSITVCKNTSMNTNNNGIDIFGNEGDILTTDGIIGIIITGDTITGQSSGATARVLKTEGSDIYIDQKVGTFTLPEIVVSTSGGSANATSRTPADPFMSGSCYGNNIDGALNGIFLETVGNFPTWGNNIKNITGGGGIHVNRIESPPHLLPIHGNTFENCDNAGIQYTGICESETAYGNTFENCLKGIEAVNIFYSEFSGNTMLDVTTGYRIGNGSKNTISGGSIRNATTGIEVFDATHNALTVQKVKFQNVTTRMDTISDSVAYIPDMEGALVTVDNSFTPNLETATEWFCDLTANATMNSPGGFAYKGMKFTVIFRQDGVGGHTLTFGALYRFKNPVSTTVNRRSAYTFQFDGNLWYSIGESNDY